MGIIEKMIPGIGAASGIMDIAGSIINPIMQAKQNKKNQEFQREQYNTQRKDNLSDYNRENQYNSPSAQMTRLKDAGLNPNMVYGNGAVASGGSVNSASAQASPGAAPQFNAPDLGGKLGQMQSIQNAASQNDILAKQLETMEEQRLLTIAQRKKTEAETPGLEYTSTMKGELSKIYPEKTREELRKLTIGNDNQINNNLYKRDANFRAETALENDTKRTLQQNLESQARMSNIPAQRQVLLEQAKNLSASRAFTEIKTKSQETQNETLKFIQEGQIIKNKILQGDIRAQDTQHEIDQIRIKFKGAGLSETATSDLIKMIFGMLPQAKW